MLTTILVPIDGSPLSERALPYASALARVTGACVVLLLASAAVEPGEEVEAALDRAAKQLPSDCRRVERVVQPVASPDEAHVVGAILETVSSRQASLILMSTHGRGGIGRWIFGSVADRVLHRSPVPVLLVPPYCASSWPEGRPTHLLVPLDGSPLAEAALRPAAALAAQLKAELILTRVVDLAHYGYADTYIPINPEVDSAGVREYLDSTAARLRAEGSSVRAVDKIGFTVSAIATTAREEATDLIVMATHGRSGLARVVLGSVATGVLQRADVPLLLVRPPMGGDLVAGSAAASHEPVA